MAPFGSAAMSAKWIILKKFPLILTCRFRASLKHKDDGQIKLIKLNSQKQDIIIKYWVSIGSIDIEQG